MRAQLEYLNAMIDVSLPNLKFLAIGIAGVISTAVADNFSEATAFKVAIGMLAAAVSYLYLDSRNEHRACTTARVKDAEDRKELSAAHEAARAADAKERKEMREAHEKLFGEFREMSGRFQLLSEIGHSCAARNGVGVCALAVSLDRHNIVTPSEAGRNPQHHDK